jgi:small subunit ribosomal protein S16
MLAIKLQRIGKKHQPSFRVVVAEKRSKLGGPPVEQLGTYDPRTKIVMVEKERVEYWLKVGAKPTPTVHNLLVKTGAISGPKIAVKIKKKAKESVATPVAAPVSPAPAAPVAEVKEAKTEEPPKDETEKEPETRAQT